MPVTSRAQKNLPFTLPTSLLDYASVALDSVTKRLSAEPTKKCSSNKVAGNYQYQWARRILCDPTSTLAGGMDKEQLKLRLSGLLGVELSDGEMDVLFRKYADP